MEFLLHTHPLLVPSNLAAKEMADRWTKWNDYRQLLDAAQCVWQVKLSETQGKDAKGPFWEIKLWVEARVGARELVSQGTLDATKDERLISLLDHDQVPLMMRPRSWRHVDQTALWRQVFAFLPVLKDMLQKSDLHHVKRLLVVKWIEKKTEFGGMMDLEK